jgi:hypothetical protein
MVLGSERVRGQLDNTEVFRLMAEALGLGASAVTTTGVTPDARLR